jgi:hypothetical protein
MRSFSDVQRIIVRLRIVQVIHPAKSLPAVERIDTLIADEEKQLTEANEELKVRSTLVFDVHSGSLPKRRWHLQLKQHTLLVRSTARSSQWLPLSTQFKLRQMRRMY